MNNDAFVKNVASRLIELIRNGTAPWQKPWEPGASFLPFNPTNGTRYKGINVVNLLSRGYGDARWMTYRQAQTKGYQVNSLAHWQIITESESIKEPRGRSRSQSYSQIALLHSHLFLHDQLTFADISGTDIGLAQLPDGATLQRPDEMRQQMVRQASSVPGVSHTVEFTGFSGLDGTNRSNAVTTFLVLAPFEERKKDPKENGFAILAEVQRRFATLQKGRALVFPPPPVQGIGNAGGFKLQVEDRRAAGLPALQAATDALIGKTIAQPGIATAFTTFRSQAPQLYLNIDRRKAGTLGVPLNSIFGTLQGYLGSAYVNDFNFLNRVYQVNIQAENAFRLGPESIRRLYTRNQNNEMVPLSTLLNITETNGPDKVMHYNLYPSADINGVPQPGFSSGQAM